MLISKINKAPKYMSITQCRLCGMILCFFAGIPFGEAQIMPKSINSSYKEIQPVISPDGNTLYFVRMNHPQNTHGAEDSQDIWSARKDSETERWQPARHLGAPFNRQYYNAVYSVSPDGNRLLIAGAYRAGKYTGRGVSVSYFKNGIWRQPNELRVKNYERMAKGKYSTASLSADGNVLLLSFSTKKNGPQSEISDLYVSFREEDDNWSQPKSLGTVINGDETNEFSPFLASDGKTLYYASDREGGLGSTDIYRTTRKDKTWENWSEPKNLGPNVNTPGFDAYYSISASGEDAYLVTYGQNGNEDIKRVELEQPNRPDPVVLIKGNILADDGSKLDGVIIWEQDGSTQTVTVNGDKAFSAVFEYGRSYRIKIVSDGYEPLNEVLDLRRKGDYEERIQNFKLKPLEGGDGSGGIAANVDAGKDGATGTSGANGVNAQGRNIRDDGGTSSPGSGSAASNNPTANANSVNGRQLDANGNGNNSVNARKQPAVSQTEVPYDPKIAKILEQRRAQRANEQPLKELTVRDLSTLAIFFDYNKAELDSAYHAELNGLAKLMNDIPRLRLYVKGHTDSIGPESYNEDLSQERAEVVRNYLITQGVDSNRLAVRAMGEQEPVYSNETSMDRTVNRRVDFANATKSSSSKRRRRRTSARN